MKRLAWLFMVVLPFFLLGACSNEAGGSEVSRQRSIALFDFLNRGQYREAVGLYAGSDEILVDFNPALDPGDRPALLKNGCELNGLGCWTVLSAEIKNKHTKEENIFLVQFKDARGNWFVRQTPNALLGFIHTDHVMKRKGGAFRVLDLPPCVP